MRSSLVVTLLWCASWAGAASARPPDLPPGARSSWVVGDVHEIVAYVTFDPARVAALLPDSLRFITVDELADGHVGWAVDERAAHPERRGWGISFVEIVRAGVFTVDGRSPRWPADGAIALWCARVAPARAEADLGPGRPLLLLGLWVPDRAYAGYLRGKGFPATYGDARLARDSLGAWHGSLEAADLHVGAACADLGPVTGGAGSAGAQSFFPPRSLPAARVIRVAFAGHRECECGAGSSWSLRGGHPLAGGVVLGPPVLEYGYELAGGTYRR
jgi:hypothetical protein